MLVRISAHRAQTLDYTIKIGNIQEDLHKSDKQNVSLIKAQCCSAIRLYGEARSSAEISDDIMAITAIEKAVPFENGDSFFILVYLFFLFFRTISNTTAIPHTAAAAAMIGMIGNV